MNLRSLRYLTALADTLHFGRAAERCFVSQPTLSMQIKRLEERLGVQLVERRHKRVMLTDIGVEITCRARRVIAEADEILALAKQNQDPLTGHLRLGLIPTLGPYLLPRVIAQLHAKLPDLELLLYEQRTASVLAMLASGELDAGLLALPAGERTLVERPLFDEPFYVALPADHSLASRETLTVADLDNERLLLLEDGHCLRDQALEVCHRSDIREMSGFRATSLETLRQMVAAGVGITLLPALAVTGAAPSELIVARPFAAPAPWRSIGAVWRPTSPRVAAIEAVCDVIGAIAEGGSLAGPDAP